MKKIFNFLFLLFIPFLIQAQFASDLVVYNPYGESFKLYLNGNEVNSYFDSKVRVNDLQAGAYNLDIVFSNPAYPQISQNVLVPSNSELACQIERNRSGIYYLEVFEVLNYGDKYHGGNGYGGSNYNPPPPATLGFCDFPMQDGAFGAALATIKTKDFDGDKLTIAKQIAMSNCLYAAQIKTIIEQFDFESNKLEFAKFAYTHCYDPNNYFIVNEAFDFSSSIKKLSDYIATVH